MKSNWEIRPLGELVKFSSGGTPSKKNPDYWNGTIPWISAKTMKDERVSTSDLMITEEGLASGSKLAPIGSLLLLTRGSGLFNGIPLCIVEKPVAFNQDVKCIESCTDVSNKFIFYWLKSQEEYLRAKLEVTGIGAGKFDTKFLQELNVPIPCKEERDKIVSIAESISKKIIINTKINDNLQQQALTLFARHYEQATNTVPFTSVIQILGGGTPKTSTPLFWNGSVPFFTPKDVGTPYTLATEKTITEDGLAHCNSRLYPVNTVFVTARGTVGKIGMPGVPMAMNQSCYALVGKGIDQILVYFYTLQTVQALKHKASGAVFDAITTRDFENETIRLISDHAAAEFLSVATPMFSQILSNSIENLRLADLRDALLPHLMTGEIDVSDIDI